MELLETFKHDILSTDTSSLSSIFEDYFICRDNWYFTNLSPNTSYELKNSIAEIFNLDLRDVIIVGSSQIGFSISPSGNKKYNFSPFREYEEDGKEESDIDVAIISEVFFEDELKKLYKYLGGYQKKFINEKFDGIATKRDKKKYFQDYASYLLKGWMRSDKMPLGYDFLDDDTNTKLNGLRKKHNRKVNIGLYKSMFYLKEYHTKNLQSIKEYLELGE